MNDPEARLHIHEIKVRLTPVQRERLLALARARDIPPAVLARELLLAELRAVERALGQAGGQDRRAA